ncbi:MAG: membrane protein insertase YidC [Candidatus Ryanbacteria bacterium]|nr:membrane protein insertase YidC [Candidatus Ryanbacteria bacterium]
MISFVFHNFFYQPLLNILAAITLFVPGNNLGVAIIVLTLLVNLALLPLTRRAKISQEKTRALQPDLERIKKQYKNNPQKLLDAQRALYHEHGISMRANIAQFLAFLFIQLPLFIALYRLFGSGGLFEGNLYAFMPDIPKANPIFLGIFDLTRQAISANKFTSPTSYANLALAILTAGLQYLQTKTQAAPSKNMSEFERTFQSQAKYIFPGLIFVLCATTPAALALYWTSQSVFAIVHEKKFMRYGRDTHTNKQ